MTTDEVERIAAVPMGREYCPTPLLWESDGACWKGVETNPAVTGADWRWQPMNWRAFAKELPEGEMSEFPPTFALIAAALRTQEQSK